MARTWPVTRRKRMLLSAFDLVARPLAPVLLREKRAPSDEVRKILVLELWHMGDVVLATSVLQSLRTMYPRAHITLLAKEHARELLEASGLADEIVTYDFPWTASESKYDPARYDASSIRNLVKRLRAEQFDVSIDCRMDLRSNALTASIGARRRIGYDFGGGSFMLTDAVAAPPADQHKVDDWMGLLPPLRNTLNEGIPPAPEPKLAVTDRERADAARLLASYDVGSDDIIVGIHPGGSHEGKRWPTDNFAELGRRLAQRDRVRLVVLVDPDGCGSDMQLENAIVVRTSIREMMAMFTQCDLVVCNDSGPMHIAAALGIPVVAVFRTGSPAAYGPRGLNHTVVGSGAPWGQVSDVPFDDVLSAAESALSVVRADSVINDRARA